MKTINFLKYNEKYGTWWKTYSMFSQIGGEDGDLRFERHKIKIFDLNDILQNYSVDKSTMVNYSQNIPTNWDTLIFFLEF